MKIEDAMLEMTTDQHRKAFAIAREFCVRADPDGNFDAWLKRELHGRRTDATRAALALRRCRELVSNLLGPNGGTEAVSLTLRVATT